MRSPGRGRSRTGRGEEPRGKTSASHRPSGPKSPAPYIAMGVGLLALVGALILVVGRGGSSTTKDVAKAETPWVPQGPAAASSEAWTAALRAWRPKSGASEAADVAAAAQLVAATKQTKTFRRSVADLLRAGDARPWLADLVKAVDGSVWRVRPPVKAAKWKGLDAYRTLEPFANGALVFPAQVASVDAAIAILDRYDRAVAAEATAKDDDALRAAADPDGRGLSLDAEADGLLWLASKSAGADAAAMEAQAKLYVSAIRSIWPFVSKVPFDGAFGTKRLALLFDPAAKRYDGLGDEGARTIGVAHVPWGDAIETRLAAAVALILGSYDAAFRLDCSRNRENVRHALALRWGLAFATYPADLAPNSFPVMRDRGRDALKKALGASPRVPAWGSVLDAALQEDVRQSDDARISDLDPVRRAAYVFLAYRMIMRWRILAPWSEEQMRALAEQRPIPFGHDPKTREELSWPDFAHRLKAAADDPGTALQYRGGAQLVELNGLFSEHYVPWVLAGEPSTGGVREGR